MDGVVTAHAAMLAEALLGGTGDLQKYYTAQGIDAPLISELINCVCGVWTAT